MMKTENNETVIINRKKELENCVFVKTFLMFSIVLYHSMAFWSGGWFTANAVYKSKILSIFSQWLNSIHIYCFVLVSGYIYCAKYLEDDNRNFLNFVRKKAKRLLVPYIFTAIVWVIPISSIFFDLDIITIVRNFVFAINPSQLWFIIMLFNVFLIAYPLSDFFAKHNISGLAMAIACYIIGTGGGYLFPDIIVLWNSLRYIVFFFLGFKLYQKGYKKLEKIPSFVWIVLDGIIFLFSKWISNKKGVVFILLNRGFHLFLYIIGALMAFVLLQKLAKVIEWKKIWIFRYFSRYSMPIYLFHQQVIYFFIYWLNGKINPYINVLINFIGSMLISTIISCVLMKFRVMRFLVGEK